MGIKSGVIVAPSAFVELAQRAATFQAAFESSGVIKFANETKIKLEQFGKLIQPEIQKLVKAGNLLKQQIGTAFANVKTWVKKLFVKYLPIALPLADIPRPQIPPSTNKALQLPNSYRSHSPPFCSVIK